MRFLHSILTIFALLLVGPATAQEDSFNQLVGKWRNISDAFTILVESDGSVFAQGEFSGAVERSSTGGGNFAFENSRGERCVYSVVTLEKPMEGATSWGLRSGAQYAHCFKTGVFVRVKSSKSSAQSTPDASQAYGATAACNETFKVEVIYWDGDAYKNVAFVFDLLDTRQLLGLEGGGYISKERPIYYYLEGTTSDNRVVHFPNPQAQPDKRDFFKLRDTKGKIKLFKKTSDDLYLPCM